MVHSFVLIPVDLSYSFLFHFVDVYRRKAVSWVQAGFLVKWEQEFSDILVASVTLSITYVERILITLR